MVVPDVVKEKVGELPDVSGMSKVSPGVTADFFKINLFRFFFS